MAVEQFDSENIWRCPSLGGGVPFRHCRTTNVGLPCGRLPECWGRRMDVEEFLKSNYSEEDLKKIFAPPPGRIERILETAEKFSKSRTEEER
jgi:hypothetical protein